MTQLNGKLFYTDQRDGLAVIAPEYVLKNIRKVRNVTAKLESHEHCDTRFKQEIARGLAHIATTPIFSFLGPMCVQVPPKPAPWLTGSWALYTMLTAHIKDKGGIIEVVSDLPVPFPTMSMEYHVWSVGEPVRLRRALEFVTSEDEFEREFGVTIRQVMRGMKE